MKDIFHNTRQLGVPLEATSGSLSPTEDKSFISKRQLQMHS